MNFSKVVRPLSILVMVAGSALGVMFASTPRPPQFILVLDEGFLPAADGGRFLDEVTAAFRSSLSAGGIETELDSGRLRFEAEFENPQLDGVIRESWTQARERVISKFKSDSLFLEKGGALCLDLPACVLAINSNEAKYLYFQKEAEVFIPASPPVLIRGQESTRVLTPENALIGASAGGALAASVYHLAVQLRRRLDHHLGSFD